MNFTLPKVFCIAKTGVIEEELSDYLNYIGANEWSTDGEDAEKLIEVAGRNCYRSFDLSLNPNLTRVRSGNKTYIENILKSKHGSVLEHAYVTFAIEDCSRIFTHELVRHRLSNFSQVSMRFVRPTTLSSIFPDCYTKHLNKETAEKVEQIFRKSFEQAEVIQQELIDVIGLDSMTDFNLKKIFQSANRRCIPDGVCTGIIITSNHRNWRHMIELRTSKHAEEEIIYVFNKIAFKLEKMYPHIYQDLRLDNKFSLYNKTCYNMSFEHGRV